MKWLITPAIPFQDTMMMGADYYQTESEIASLLAEGKVPIGVGQNTKIRLDRNLTGIFIPLTRHQ